MSESKCGMGKININGHCQKVKNIVISGKRWFDSVNGNTYHSVDVYVNGVHVAREPYEYGYGEQYIQTAHRLLQEKGVYKKTGEHLKSGADKDYYDFMMDMRNNRNKFVVTVADVARKKDL